MIDSSRPGSPGWWLERLTKKLDGRRGHYDMLDTYFRGEQGIPVHASKACRDSYRRLMGLASTNFAQLAVEAVRARMAPLGFRTGGSDDPNGDAEAWRIWQANSLDADVSLIFRAALSMGDSYAIVGGVEDEIDAPLITPEDPREVVTESDPRRRRKVRAALKLFTDEVDELDWAYLYLPGLVFKASRHSAADHPWEWAEGTPERLPAPVVPVVRFSLWPGMGGEFECHLPILDRINYAILTRLEIATLQAFRQRAVKGVPSTDEQGDEIDYDDIFAADPGALWILPETAEMWESGQVDLGPVRESIKDDVRDFAAATQTPMYLFTPDAASGSAEGASLLREGLVFKVGDRIPQASESLEQVMALAFLFSGDAERARRSDMEVIWRPPALFSLSERADAAAKAKAGGVTWRTIMTDIWQFSPQQVERMEAERISEALSGEGLAMAGLFGAPGDQSS